VKGDWALGVAAIIVSILGLVFSVFMISVTNQM